MRPYSVSASVPLLLSPLAAGIVWAEGQHTDETQLSRHDLLANLAPNAQHHPIGLWPLE